MYWRRPGYAYYIGVGLAMLIIFILAWAYLVVLPLSTGWMACTWGCNGCWFGDFEQKTIGLLPYFQWVGDVTVDR